MRALLVSRYPRVDTLPWKVRVATDLLDHGVDVAVLYSRSTLADQARAGLRQEGIGALRHYLALRGSVDGGPAPAVSLASWARGRGLHVVCGRRLGDSVPAVRRLAPDLLVLLGADIAPASLLAVPPLGTINAHYGLLPAFRGMNVTEWSVYCGAPLGVTVHLVDAGIDTGPIVLREEIPVEAGETFATLRRRHQELAARLLVRAALALRDRTAAPVPQDPAGGLQYYRMHPAVRRVAEARLRAQAS